MRISTFYLFSLMGIVFILLMVESIFEIGLPIDYINLWFILLTPILSKVFFPNSMFTEWLNKVIFIKTLNKLFKK